MGPYSKNCNWSRFVSDLNEAKEDIMLKKLLLWFHDLVATTCNAPYDCPWCMHCYNNPSELPDSLEMINYFKWN